MWILYCVIGTWLLLLGGAVFFAGRFGSDLGRPVAPGAAPRAVVIVAVKGASPFLPRFLSLLRAQAYAGYRVVASVEAADDPAMPHLRAACAGPGAPLTIVVAGQATRQGQKVQNLLRALDEIGPGDEIVAFIDADTLPLPDWLPRLVQPLANGSADVVTGYRWLMPVDGGWPSAVVAAANASVVTLPRVWHVLWGGTMGMHRNTIERLDLRRELTGAIVDDVHMTRLCHRQALRITRPRDLLLASPVRHSWQSALAFGRRQYLFIRWYFPGLWAVAAVMLTLPVLATTTAIVLALRGDPVAIGALALACALAQLRARYRARIVSRLWGGSPLAAQLRPLWADRWLAPVWLPFHAACLWSAALSRRMWWAGYHYEFRGYNEVRVLAHIREDQGPPRSVDKG